MIKNLKLIAIDMDGTTLRDDKTISPRTKEAIKRLISRGIIIVPSTGRPSLNLIEEVLGIEGIDYSITSNGAQLTDYKNKKIIHEAYLPADAAVDTIRRLKSFNGYIYAHSDDKSLNAPDPYGESQKEIPNILKDQKEAIEMMEEYILKNKPPIQKIAMLSRSREDQNRVLSSKHLFKNIHVNSSGANNIEFNSLEASKGIALRRLCRMLNIPREQVAAIGDNENDLSMLRFAGYKVAMGNALASVKKAANEITLTNQEDGVAAFLEKIAI